MKIGSSNLGQTTAGRPRRPSFTLELSASLAVIVGMSALAFPEPASAGEAGPAPNVTILIYNYAQATRAVLAEAEREAGRIFAEAGVQILWFECPAVQSTADPPAPCQKGPESPEIRLQLLSAPVRSKSQDSVWGLAVLPSLASVYYQYVVRLVNVNRPEFDVARILGSVIAHEIGHLLLGPNSHYGTGIMRPQWSFQQLRRAMMGILLFTPEQAKAMRADARSRMRLEAASLGE